MARILYNDGRIAVCRYQEDEVIPPNESVIKLLINLTPETIDNRIEEIITLTPTLISFFDNPEQQSFDENLAERRNAIALADVETLEALGFKVTEDSLINRYISVDDLGMFAISVPNTKKKVLLLADYIQFLAKLYLLSKGEEKHADLLPDICIDESGMYFDAALPYEFAYGIESQRLKTLARFDRNNAVHSGWEQFTIPVRIEFVDIMRSPYHHEESGYKLPSDPFELKKIAAIALFETLVCYQSATPFTLDLRTLEFKQSDNDTFASTLGKCVIDNKVHACPMCGRPVLLLRKSSKPFCKPSHQTRYHEKAHAMFNNGATVDEVHDAFPYIQHATIANWQR